MPKIQKGKLIKCSDSVKVYLMSILHAENINYTMFDENHVFIKNDGNEIELIKERIKTMQDDVADKKPLLEFTDG